ncbi:hypothetical protein ACLOJK_039853 [Asimina triloba]
MAAAAAGEGIFYGFFVSQIDRSIDRSSKRMAFRLNSGDVSAFKCFVSLATMYAVMSAFSYRILHMKHVRPLPLDAPPHRYSEARAVAHVWKLAHDIGGRQAIGTRRYGRLNCSLSLSKGANRLQWEKLSLCKSVHLVDSVNLQVSRLLREAMELIGCRGMHHASGLLPCWDFGGSCDVWEGRPGLSEAALYIKRHLEMLAERAGSHLRIEVDETHVSGSFNMMFLRHSISLGYRDHINVAVRISSSDSNDADPSVLINGHFDSPLGSHGAADCASCVGGFNAIRHKALASMLEIARVIVDSGWVPPQPVILLFNGAEELFMLCKGSHGFMKTHRWRDSVGAFINVEASGTGGLDLVCQAGPGSWPTLVYAQSAIYPMAHSAAQDVFHVIPGDTDYRIFAEDFGNIPGLDIIFLLGGYFYHTSYDTVERLLPGSMQARGENLFSLIKAFTSSSMLLNAQQRVAFADAVNGTKDDRPISYPRKAALFLHSLPIVIFFVMPLFSRLPKTGVRSLLATFSDLMKGFTDV